MLTGSDLLSFVNDHKGAGKTELVRGAGYVSTKKDGSERLNFTAFYEALLEARGVSLDPQERAKPGRSLSYETKVQFNGNLLIGKGYVAEAGFNPGDVFSIKATRGGFYLRPLATGDQEEVGSLPFDPSEDQSSAAEAEAAFACAA
jgi:hypothetical protein